MQVQLTLLLLFLSFNSLAVSDKDLDELFKKYEQVMDGNHPELIEKVFTKSFLDGNGGAKEFQKKVIELNKVSKNSPYQSLEISWKQGVKGTIYFVNVKKIDPYKAKVTQRHGSRFVVVEESGKELKINGTISDAN